NMRNALILILLLISSVCYSDDFSGSWKGKGYSVELDTIEIAFYVSSKKDSIISVTLKEPISFMLADSSFNGTDLHMQSPDWLIKSQNKHLLKKQLKGEKVTLYQEIKFDGALTDNKNHLKGEFTYLGKVYQADLYRGEQPIFRPQEPKKPYPYRCEEVKFLNKKDNVVLAGTLTMPAKEGKFPAVILKGGSIPINRDGEVHFHKTFLVLADYLTRNGIAVLRYDDRGIGESKGDFFASTLDDFSEDLIAGYEFLASRKEINSEEIGLMGHSEGGVVVSMAANQCNVIKFVVMLGGPGIPFSENAALQTELKYKYGDLTKEQFDLQTKLNERTFHLKDSNLISKEMLAVMLSSKDGLMNIYLDSSKSNTEKRGFLKWQYNELIKTRNNAHFLSSLDVVPADYNEKLTCPVLYLIGTNDMLVPAKVNQEAIRQALTKAGNKDYKIVELVGLNHNFQECKIGSIKEASTLEQTFSPKALEQITQWIEDHVE
ncbi:MAG TPA: alpha/beta fold hydrolase, partial [Prolixibacteraceae bacterium]|nr:alpha/beta fold hydrolase [Prolixibacteraceae bacterium]